MRRAGKIALIVIGTLVVLLAVAFGLLQTGFGKRAVLRIVESELADPPVRLQARSLEGFVPFELTLNGDVLSDAEGTWLTVDHVTVLWSPLALFEGKLSIKEIHAGIVTLVRAPVAPPAAPAKARPRQAEPSLPSLPFAVDLDRLAVDRLDLASGIIGDAAAFSIGAEARLGDPAAGLQAKLAVTRIDRDRDRASLDLDYRPAADTLTVDVSAEEPQGGLVTHLMGLPGSPKLQARIQGSGPLSAWQARGSATLDDKPLLDLTASSQGATTARRVGFDLKLAQIPMLPTNLAPLVEGGIAAQGKVHIAGTEGAIGIEALQLQTRAGSLAVKGTADPAGSVDLDGDLKLGDATPFATLLPPDLGWDNVAATFHLAGPVAKPKVTVDAAIANLRAAGNQVGRSDVSAEATIDTGALRATDVTASLTAAGIVAADPRLQPLLDDGASLDFAGALDQTGAVTADTLELHAGSVALDARGLAQGWGDQAAHLDGKLTIDDLAPALAIGGLKGGGRLETTLALDKQQGTLSAELESAFAGLSLGIAPADRLLGAAPKLSLAVHQDAGGLITIDRAVMQAAALDLNASGTISADRQLALKADARLPDLGEIAPDLKGDVALAATITGAAADPSAAVQVTSAQLKAATATVAALRATIDATGLVTAPKAAVKAQGTVSDLPAALALNVAADPAKDAVTITDLKAHLSATVLEGKLALVGSRLDGALSFVSPNLGEIGKLAGQQMSGSAEGTITLDNPAGKQRAAIKADAKTLEVGGVTVAAATLDGSGNDLLGTDPGLDAAMTANGIVLGGRQIDRLTAKANGTLADLVVAADASGPQTALATQATIARKGDTTSIVLAKLDLAVNAVKASLLRPAEITLRPGETKVAGFALGANGGEITLEADLAPAANTVDAKLERLPLSVLGAAAPDLKLLGTLDGTVTLSGTKDAPSAALALQGRGLGVAGASAQLADLDLDGTWRGRQFASKGHLALSKASALDFSAALPLPAGADGLPAFDPGAPLQAHAAGKIDLGIVNAFIPGGADYVAGLATVDLAAGGTVGTPALSGKAQVADGRYDNHRYGTRLRGLTAELDGSGTALRLVSLAAQTPDGGKLEGDGTIDFAGDMPVKISIRLMKARMLDAPIGTAVTDADITAAGTLGKALKVSGKVKVLKAEIRIPDQLPVDVEEIPVKEINLPPERAAQLAAENAPPPKTLKTALDLTVDAPGQVFIRGHGLDAELGGNLKITGTADAPVITGALNLKRGTFNLLSRRLDFSRGAVTFSGGAEVNPILDFAATTKLAKADVTATITGTASHPVIALTSNPTLPQDEILAQLLFGKDSGGLSPFEALQLAQAMAELSGVSTGPNVLDKLRKGLGLDRLDIEAGQGAQAAPSLTAGRYVTRGVFVGAKQGAKPNSSAATVEIEVTPNIKVETEAGADSGGKAGVNLEWNY